MRADTENSNEPTPSASRGVRRVPSWLLVLGYIVFALVLLFAGMRSFEPDASTPGDAIRTNRFQAVYMTNDRVYFGRLRDEHGDWFTLQDAYFLRRAATDAGTKDAQTPATTEIVPVKQEVGGDGDLVINAREVTLVQNLAASSEVARTIEDAER